MKVAINKLHYKKYLNIVEIGLIALLLPLSFFYYIVTNFRNMLYSAGLIKKYRPKAYTISVGNITTGGVGKTPIVSAIANFYNQKGRRVAILSRGYGGKLSSKNINVISDFKEILYNPENAGDEPYWLAENCKNVAILTSANRSAIAEYAEKKMKCEILILDDGFQHQKLARNLNILVLDYEKRFGNRFVLPTGPLRESLSQVCRADKIVVVNKTNNVIDAKTYCHKLNKKYKKDVLLANMEYACIYSLESNLKITKTKKLLAFSAIAQPEQFYEQLRDNEQEIVATYTFADHHIYKPNDIAFLNELAIQNDVDHFITTEKDAVKIKDLLNKELITPEKDILVVKLHVNLDVEELLNEEKN